jgi:transposase, IS30 family
VARAHVLTESLRQVIENLWGVGSTFAEIATALGVVESTIYREVQRHHSYRQGVKNPLGRRRGGLYRWGYRATRAHARAEQRRRRPKPRKLGVDGALRRRVVAGLGDRFSPQQVATRLRVDFPDAAEMWVSHETIYQAIYVQGRGSLRLLVDDQLRVTRKARRSQSRAAQAARGAIRGKPWVTEAVHISARPAEVADRAVPGHWEGDLLIGAHKRSAIVTLAERATRFVMLGALPVDRSSPEVIAVIRRLFARLPARLHASLTWDQGVELAGYAQFGLADDCAVYFCDPHSPWQRGTNENTNGLLRDYFPKGRFDFTTITQTDLDAVADQLNRRPRQTLDWRTPAEKINELLAPTT